MDQKKRALIISSVPITHFGNLGADRVSALEEYGYDVDYLTKYQDDNSNVIGIYSPQSITNCLRKVKSLLPSCLVNILRRFCPFLFPKDNYIRGNGIVITSVSEDFPVVDNESLLSLIEPIYSFVFVLAWQDMITSQSLKAIYEKLKVPIILTLVDFQPITGGCYYFGDCRNFENECGNCPALERKAMNDMTHYNFQTKKEIYNSINCGFMVNPYSLDFIKQSKIISENRLRVSYYTMNENLYRPLDKSSCRNLFRIEKHKKYVIFSRFTSVGHERKGYIYLLAAINKFAEIIGSQKDEVVLLLAGGKDELFESKFNIDVLNVGMLNVDELINAYSAADLFLSSSIDDAGPSMVNQSIMCGTPVLSFNIGSALYMIDNGETGYRVPLKDVDAMANCLDAHFNLSNDERKVMQNKCRCKGLETGSRGEFAKKLVLFAEELSKYECSHL